MHSFLLIGQSNMAGRGRIADAHEIDTTHIYTLINGRWHKMFRPINHDCHFSGVNLAESFAEAYAKKHNVEVGLICCAEGGTKLAQWMPGELLYDNAVNCAKLAQRTSKIVGVLWHQGESDRSYEEYSTYQVRFEKMMASLRKDLNLHDVPFLLGGLGEYLAECTRFDFSNYTHVNEALKSITQANKLTAFVPADGLTAKNDTVHFDSDSLYEFGLRYFDVFEQFKSETVDRTENCVAEDIKRSELELI